MFLKFLHSSRFFLSKRYYIILDIIVYMRTALFGLEKARIFFNILAFFLHVVFEAYAAELSPVLIALSVVVSLSFASSNSCK